ncbi:hypothetical protein VD0002_g6928 [Verticillium dahliae]|uniref:Uncharacterized protein n=1 Tax=Verticillium dahliae TaxID=27337 RepID=A0AA44WUJ9_VERDA|nr:Zinc-regulated transporter 2 [Verticillium dahliae VDG2]KAH6702690.1 hypothetical protein EV126DRAFT_233885 [Verticillium dahliae]PNH36445.1 hypothetical protein BJF96_g9 [Verticillium dahliae]PNH49123.1 hypothetical protein VD0003_g8005 [Verticillium dahliae]PNH60751.1 hypothetical protein VD0002_g6928 [Verticillium dahliae]
MRFNTLAGAALAATSAVMAKELPKNEELAAELYDSGVIHEQMMARKMAHWTAEFEAGLLQSSKWPRLNYTKCVNGYAEAIKGDPLHKFKCKNIDLYDFINHSELGSPNSDASFRTGSSAWGWTDPESGREFVTSGMYDGAAFLEVLPEGRLLHLGFLPSYAPTGPRSLWKEIRSYKNYMLIGSELEGHGIQIFDMRKLLTIKASDAPVRFSNDKDLTGHFADLPVGRSHNVVINEEANYGVAVGAAPRNGTCQAGLIFFDLTDPSKPTRLGCNGEDGYVHDAHCLIYRGPHKKYEGRDICYGYNEDTLTIYDVTDKANSKIISITSYEGATYTHQGWVLDVNNQEYLFLDDEIDEEESAGPAADGYPVTYIFDIRDLEHPKQTGLYKAAVRGIDHNQYIRDGLNFQSNYGAGVRVYDVSSVPEDPTGDSVCEVAFLDIYPEDDNEPGGGIVQYSGTWASYAQFDSGYIFINTIERGAFLAKLTKRERCKPKSCNADNCLRALRSSSVKGRLEESQEFCAGFLDGWNAQVTAVPEYAQKACPTNVISRVSSACSCLPTAAPTTA